jgi:hypothetical protein
MSGRRWTKKNNIVHKLAMFCYIAELLRLLSHLSIVGGNGTCSHYLYKWTVPTTWQVYTGDMFVKYTSKVWRLTDAWFGSGCMNVIERASSGGTIICVSIRCRMTVPKRGITPQDCVFQKGWFDDELDWYLCQAALIHLEAIILQFELIEIVTMSK